MRAAGNRQLFLFIVALAIPVAVPTLHAQEDEGPHEGGLRKRLEWLNSRFGITEPQERLDAMRQEYEARRAQARRSALAVAGTNWKSLGPTNGAGRVSSIAFHPSDPNTLFVAAATGGVWKSTDRGTTWQPLTDDIGTVSIGAIAVDPTNPDIIYVGTGEADALGLGIGLLKSTDGGRTWSFPATVLSNAFYAISINPANTQELLAATISGAYRSTDGGATWAQVISDKKYLSVTGLSRHPTQPNVVWATTWDADNWCASTQNCSYSSPRLLKSLDGGATWTEKGNGAVFNLPASTTSTAIHRMSLAISPTNPSTMYVLFETSEGQTLTYNPAAYTAHIYKSINEGETWAELRQVSRNSSYLVQHLLSSQGWYNNAIVVSPSNDNVVIAAGTYYTKTTDAGVHWDVLSSSSQLHVDVHQLRYNGTTLWIANDGGIWSSSDDATTVEAHNRGLVIRQYYSLTSDPSHLNRIFAGSQDNGTDRRPDSGGTEWDTVTGGDAFEPTIDANVPSIAYIDVTGRLYRIKDTASKTPTIANVTPYFSPQEPGSTFPVAVVSDPQKPTTLYFGSWRVWRTVNGAETWEPLPTKTSDGSTWPPNGLVRAIAVAPSDSSTLMVAINDLSTLTPSILRSTDGGRTWTDVTSNVRLSPRYLINVAIDSRDPKTAYVTLSGHRPNRVWKTTDGGVTWEARSDGLPPFPAIRLRIDPTDSNVLYCATQVGIFRSTDAGVTWSRFGTGLPNVEVDDISILKDDSSLRIGTYGRGAWELEVPPLPNSPPTVGIASTSPLIISRGATIAFEGSVSDPDSGDTANATWTFPDDWESLPMTPGRSVAHTFYKAGNYPVTLTAVDRHGARSSAFVNVIVSEAFDDCSTPRLIPSNAALPLSFVINNETASLQPSDPAPQCVSRAYDSLWFEFTPPADGTYEFSTCGTSNYSALSIWSGPACGPYVANACSSGPCPSGDGSRMQFTALSGQTVRLQVSKFVSYDAGRSFTLSLSKVDSSGAVPVITSVSAMSGPAAGGTSVTIGGVNFKEPLTLSFGGSMTSVTLIDSEHIAATTPPHVAGTVDITVTDAQGKIATLSGGFTYFGNLPQRRRVVR